MKFLTPDADLAALRCSFQIPPRMLLIGLALNILLGIGIGIFIFKKLAIFEIAILVTMLAATDAALGKAVVTHEVIPANIREGLNVENGLYDGICVPVLFVFIALATGSGAEDGGLSLALKLVLREIGIGSGRPYVRPDRPGRCFKFPLRTASTGAVYGVSGK